MTKIISFLKAWWNSPGKIGAFGPSSSSAIKLICDSVDTSAKGYIVEFGAGTGCVTEKLIEMGLGDRLYVVELDDGLYQYLKDRFPTTNIIHGNVRDIKTLLPESVVGNVSQIVSTIPTRTFNIEDRKEIFKNAFDVMSECGKLLQVTLWPGKPSYASELEELGLEYDFVDWTPWNLPPMYLLSFEEA